MTEQTLVVTITVVIVYGTTYTGPRKEEDVPPEIHVNMLQDLHAYRACRVSLARMVCSSSAAHSCSTPKVSVHASCSISSRHLVLTIDHGVCMACLRGGGCASGPAEGNPGAYAYGRSPIGPPGHVPPFQQNRLQGVAQTCNCAVIW